jgi:hypothetical protein
MRSNLRSNPKNFASVKDESRRDSRNITGTHANCELSEVTEGSFDTQRTLRRIA